MLPCLPIILVLAAHFTAAEAQHSYNAENNPDFSREPVMKNAHHIFNAVYSSLRTWGTAMNHNGMSFFPATIPAGVKLYHGQTDLAGNKTVQGMDWLALEENFAYLYTGMPMDPTCYDHDQEAVRYSKTTPTQPWHVHQQQRLFSRLAAEDPCAPVNYTPGFLQTYTTTRPLNLLYIDGISAGKTNLGTLDTQDIILLNRTTSSPNAFSDWMRAAELCASANESWEGRIDGFLRAMVGFEVILCNFEGAVELTRSLRAERTGLMPPYVSEEVGLMAIVEIYKIVEDQFWGIGGERVSLDYERMVSVYAAEGVDIWVNGTDKPRLLTMGQEHKEEVRQKLRSMILREDNSEEGNPTGKDGEERSTINWQAVVDMTVSHYAEQLHAYGDDSVLSDPVLLKASLGMLIRPFIDHDDRNATREITRCAHRFFPSSFSPTIAATAILGVTEQICKTLFEAETILHPTAADSEGHRTAISTEETQHRFRKLFRTLIKELAWPVHKYCRGCQTGEVCFTATFPFGTRQDLETPSCQGVENMEDWYDKADYWR